uniref:Eukaryotic translation initiation factor 3 subunit L (inferred by orthology to a zebrafish protein) n=1 Tax=Strongyloides venezuelensis TaxID=75913 RepID=A0A0K0FF36_STRVS
MIGLLRLQVHLGDYNEALQCIENFSLEPKGLFTTVPNCYITVYYYIAFSHMMTKNYIEAIKLFEICSLYIQKITNVYILQNLSYSKKNKELELFNVFQDKVLILLAICLTITPQKIEESIKTLLHDKYDETYNRMISGDVTEYEKNFMIGAPKFISPNCVVYEGNSISRQSL